MAGMYDTITKDAHPYRLLLGVALAVVLHALAGLLPYADGVDVGAAQMAAAVTALVAVAWLTGALALGAASLLPLVLLPLLGVMPIDQAATAYAHPIVVMYFGGFVLALGVERWGLHRRLALNIILRAGVKPGRLVLGFMVAAALLSMWLNNTSTTLLLLPIAVALVESMNRAGAISEGGQKHFAFALLIGIAYACSIGGMATPIGTPPNAIFMGVYSPFEEAGAEPVTFLLWLAVGLPLVVVLLPLVWLLLTKVLAPLESGVPAARGVVETEARALAPMDHAERRMLGLFILVALLWTTRDDLDLGKIGTIPGWWHLFPVENAKAIGDGAVAVFVAILAFLVPSGRKPGQALMNWGTAKKLPWDILLLMGGGIAIARSFEVTGLAEAVGLALKPVAGGLPPLLLVPLVCVGMTLLTEVTSNTATTALLLPILASTATALGIDPLLLMLPATFSASCAFMLPIATPPNAIVFSSGMIPMGRMARTGLWINLLGVVVITLVTWLIAVPVLGIDW